MVRLQPHRSSPPGDIAERSRRRVLTLRFAPTVVAH
jgi:hypothetical protein